MKFRDRVGRLALSGCLVAGMASGLSAATTGVAHAGGYGCTGTQVWGPADFYGEGAYSNTVVATVYGYWDGTYNCEVAVKRVFVGQYTRMNFTLYSNNGSSSDPGSWAYQAGPVKVNGVGSCVWEEVDMWDPNGQEIAQGFWGEKHNCG